jgi:hypothetical protein
MMLSCTRETIDGQRTSTGQSGQHELCAAQNPNPTNLTPLADIKLLREATKINTARIVAPPVLPT